MEKRKLGKSGIEVSVVGLGCNNFGLFDDTKQAEKVVHKALDCGITLFDMASEHRGGAEEAVLGKSLANHRKDVVIATKFGQSELIGIGADGSINMSQDKTRKGLSRRWIMESVEESLTRLKTDYIDLYQPHDFDPETTIEETLRALDDLVKQGKVRAIGQAATNETAEGLISDFKVIEAHKFTPYVSMQTRYSMLDREAENAIIPELEKRGMSLLPYSPLANGLLTGKYKRNVAPAADTRFAKLPFMKSFQDPDKYWDVLEKIEVFAKDNGFTMLELAFAWLLSKPVVASVIAGATKPEQVQQNAATASKQLSQPMLNELKVLLE